MSSNYEFEFIYLSGGTLSTEFISVSLNVRLDGLLVAIFGDQLCLIFRQRPTDSFKYFIWGAVFDIDDFHSTTNYRKSLTVSHQTQLHIEYIEFRNKLQNCWPVGHQTQFHYSANDDDTLPCPRPVKIGSVL